MLKELNEMNIFRLDTELENAIGYRDYYLKTVDYNKYAVWDQEVETILDEIIKLGDMKWKIYLVIHN